MGYGNAEVAHRFAAGIGQRCTGHNMFFEGNTIYSYGHHFPIAIKWNGWLLFNEERYSVSTCKHQNYVAGACSHMDIVRCATMDGWSSWKSEPTDAFIDNNLKEWLREVENLTERMATARKPEMWLSAILKVVEKVERFCVVFGRPVPESFYKFKNEEEVEKAREYTKEQMRRAKELARERQDEQIQRFHEFKTNWVDLPYQIVRYREDKNRFETSKSVEIPYETGKRFYEALRDGVLKVGDMVLYYRVNQVGETIKIGCHTFKKKYLLDYGRRMFNE